MGTAQYIDIFLDESREHLQAVNDNLLKLEKKTDDSGVVDEIFRSAHTLKGMAATMGFTDLASLTHQMENVLDLIKKEEITVTTDLIDITFEAIESLEGMVSDISEGGEGKQDVSGLINKLEQIGKETVPSPESESRPQASEVDDSPELELDEYQSTIIDQAIDQGFQAYELKIFLNKDCMLKAARVFMVFEVLEELGEVIKSSPSVEELEEEKFGQSFTVLILTKEEENATQQRIVSVTEVQGVGATVINRPSISKETEKKPDEETGTENSMGEKDPSSSTSQKKQAASKTIRVNTERIDHLMNLFEEMVIHRGRLEDLSKKVGKPELTETVEHMSRVSQDMQGMMLSMRMVPVEQVFNRFPRMVRGLAKDLDKEISLDITGADTELDRTVVDEIGDPLVHLIRNSIDHGIESPEKRKQAGKTETGTLTLRAFHSGNHVFIEIQDDGDGINRNKVVEKAISNDLIARDHAEKLTKDEISNLIFASGFSTADQVSDISGRGVGLDVVRSKIESLGGHIFVESEPGQGSRFSIRLPLTLSILSTLLVNISGETYGIPLSSIEETVLLQKDEIMHMKKEPVMDFRGKVIPLVSLEKVFGFSSAGEKTRQKMTAVVVVKKGNKMTGLAVDSFIGQKEVVLKSLGDFLPDVYAVSGATILGDGSVSLIVDPNVLVN